jgi:hypothetical protein
MTSIKPALLLELLSALLLSAEHAPAWYDPGTQRWLNRDPLADLGSRIYVMPSREPRTAYNNGDDLTDDEVMVAWPRVNVNLHTFALNSPLTFLDPLGLAEDEFPPMSKCPKSGDTWRLNKGSGDRAESSEHTKNARPSTKGKHEEGQARKIRDQGGEKGDLRRAPKPGRRPSLPQQTEPDPCKPKFPYPGQAPKH